MRFFFPLFALALPLPAPPRAPRSSRFPAFRSVELRGGGDVTVVPGPVQRVTIVEGSTPFTSFRVERDGQLRIDACNERCPHNYHLRIQIERRRVPDLAVAGGGTITSTRGFAPQHQLSAAIKGGGTIDVARSRPATCRRQSTAAATFRSVRARPVGGGQRRRDDPLLGQSRGHMAIHGGGDVGRG